MALKNEKTPEKKTRTYMTCWGVTKFIYIAFLILSTLFLSSCSTLRHHDGKPSDFSHFNADKIPDAVPTVEPKSKYGNPKSYVVWGTRYTVLNSGEGFKETGIASWYGTKFHAVRTSSGEPYDMYKMTGAHKTLPLPTYVRVTNIKTGKSVIVRINDRGPFVSNRVVDLSFAAAKKLGVTGSGTAYVKLEALDPKHPDIPLVKPHNPQVYLQLGVFSNPAGAKKLESQIHAITARSTHILSVNKNGKTLYKVQVGPLSEVSEVDELTDTFKGQGLGKAFAVVR